MKKMKMRILLLLEIRTSERSCRSLPAINPVNQSPETESANIFHHLIPPELEHVHKNLAKNNKISHSFNLWILQELAPCPASKGINRGPVLRDPVREQKLWSLELPGRYLTQTLQLAYIKTKLVFLRNPKRPRKIERHQACMHAAEKGN